MLTSAIVVDSALGLIIDSLSEMGLDIHPVVSADEKGKLAESNPTGHPQGYLEYPEQAIHSFDQEEFTISDETLEAFPFLTPIDATFGIGYDQDC